MSESRVLGAETTRAELLEYRHRAAVAAVAVLRGRYPISLEELLELYPGVRHGLSLGIGEKTLALREACKRAAEEHEVNFTHVEEIVKLLESIESEPFE